MNSTSGLILDGIGTWGLICNKKNRVAEFSVHWDFFPDSFGCDICPYIINMWLRGCCCDSLEYWGILVA